MDNNWETVHNSSIYLSDLSDSINLNIFSVREAYVYSLAKRSIFSGAITSPARISSIAAIKSSLLLAIFTHPENSLLQVTLNSLPQGHSVANLQPV